MRGTCAFSSEDPTHVSRCLDSGRRDPEGTYWTSCATRTRYRKKGGRHQWLAERFYVTERFTTVIGTWHDESGQGLRQLRSLRLSGERLLFCACRCWHLMHSSWRLTFVLKLLFFRLRVVSKEWHHTFEFPPEQVYAGYFVQFLLPTSHGIA